MLFSLLVSHNTPSTVYIQEAVEGTSPIMSFLHPFVMICNKKLSAKSDIWYISSKNSPDLYAYILFCHYDHCLINTIILTTNNILNWHNILSYFIYAQL